MSDMTIEQYQTENAALTAEVEKLRGKNAELLTEKKKASGSTGEQQARIEELEAANADLDKQLRHHTVERPRLEMMQRLTPTEHLAGAAMREIEHHFDIAEEDGKTKLVNKDGTPLLIEVENEHGELWRQEVAFDEEGINHLYEHGILPALGYMLSGSKATGGGAPGSNGNTPVTSNPKPETEHEKQEPAPVFGMR